MHEAALHRLLAWSTASYPTGAFSYSHGLERAVEDRLVSSAETLVDYVNTVLGCGAGWTDAVFFVHAWRAAFEAGEHERVASRGHDAGNGDGDSDGNGNGPSGELDSIADFAAAWRGTSETALESHQQGAAFLEVTRAAWPHEGLRRFAQSRHGKSIPHSVAAAVACASHAIPLDLALGASLHAFASNLVSAGVRLIPLGQTSAQIAIARISAGIGALSVRAQHASLADLGTAAVMIDLCSMRHETQYARLFRS